MPTEFYPPSPEEVVARFIQFFFLRPSDDQTRRWMVVVCLSPGGGCGYGIHHSKGSPTLHSLHFFALFTLALSPFLYAGLVLILSSIRFTVPPF